MFTTSLNDAGRVIVIDDAITNDTPQNFVVSLKNESQFQEIADYLLDEKSRLNLEDILVYSLYPILAIYRIETLSTLLFFINLLFIKTPITSPTIIVEILFEFDFNLIVFTNLHSKLTGLSFTEGALISFDFFVECLFNQIIIFAIFHVYKIYHN